MGHGAAPTSLLGHNQDLRPADRGCDVRLHVHRAKLRPRFASSRYLRRLAGGRSFEVHGGERHADRAQHRRNADGVLCRIVVGLDDSSSCSAVGRMASSSSELLWSGSRPIDSSPEGESPLSARGQSTENLDLFKRIWKQAGPRRTWPRIVAHADMMRSTRRLSCLMIPCCAAGRWKSPKRSCGCSPIFHLTLRP